MIKPLHDHVLVEVDRPEDNPLGLIKPQADEGYKTGIVVDVSKFITYYGFMTYAFDSSLANDELLQKLQSKYEGLIGKRVYWPERFEAGMDVTIDSKRYFLIKMSALIAVDEETK